MIDQRRDDKAARTMPPAASWQMAQHLDPKGCGDRRSDYLIDNGWTAVRFWNSDVMENLDGVVETILAKTAECLGGTHPQPLPSREARRR